jgi:hypothetical protein
MVRFMEFSVWPWLSMEPWGQNTDGSHGDGAVEFGGQKLFSGQMVGVVELRGQK